VNVLDLFSGIGGFSLGLERAGMRTIAFCEIERYCRAVLAKRWPDVPCHPDVRELTADRLGERVDLICGGFPCQDISLAGDGAGLAGKRSGLWSEYHRLINELRPRWAIIENVSALRSRGLDIVLGQLAASGYDAEWYCIPARAVGAPHQRDRIWIVAYPNVARRNERREPNSGPPQPRLEASLRHHLSRLRPDLANAQRLGRDQMVEPVTPGAEREGTSDPPEYTSLTGGWSWWEVEPNVGRVADGVPSRVDRIKSLGNAVVPQIPEIFGLAILAWERQQ
jgi:DNA (cytosine-5)-methyltransferase 1